MTSSTLMTTQKQEYWVQQFSTVQTITMNSFWIKGKQQVSTILTTAVMTVLALMVGQELHKPIISEGR